MISSTIVGSILGFLGSGIGPLLDFFNQKEMSKLEINKMEKSIEMSKLGFTQDQIMYGLKSKDEEHARLLRHDEVITEKGTGWIGGLQRLVRPLITYTFFGLFVMVEWSIASAALDSGLPFDKAIQYVWDDNANAMFATVITFWFGNRVFEKKDLIRK